MEEKFLKFFEEKVRGSGWYRLIGMSPIIGDNVRVEIEIEGKHKQAFGTAHGGVIASILDSAAGLIVNKELLKQGKIAVTAEIKVNYLKPVKGGKLVAEGRIISIGSKIAVSTAEAKQNGDIVAIATATFYIMDTPPELKQLVEKIGGNGGEI
ncbi:MAG: PaaI family thioesterase [Archaeoglobus sp.]|nr:PaaI family thioesterase [Archaeoglobus sp.]